MSSEVVLLSQRRCLIRIYDFMDLIDSLFVHARAYSRLVELLDKKRGEQEPKGMVEDNSTLHLVDSTKRKK
uniref:Putative ovule protein n=1 Tax=Solanum chacoense TaxID=4108 RepID=A0A0V0HGQ7_SOLCH